MESKNLCLKPRTRLPITPSRKTTSSQKLKILSRNKNDFILLLQMKPVFQTVQIRLLLLKIKDYSTMSQKLTLKGLSKSESNFRSRGKSSMKSSMKVIRSLLHLDNHNFCLRHDKLLLKPICPSDKVELILTNLRPYLYTMETFPLTISLALWRIIQWPVKLVMNHFWLP